MALPTIDHRHCKVCGKVTKGTEEFCSKRCREERARSVQSRRNLTYLFVAVCIFLLLVSVATLHL